MSQRIRVIGGPWPERIGVTGHIVERPAGPAGQVYPWPGRSNDEVIVLLDNDPLEPPVRTFHRYWSCAIKRRHLQLEDGHFGGGIEQLLWLVVTVVVIIALLRLLGVRI